MQKLLTTDEVLLGEAGLDHCREQVVRVGHHKLAITILGV